MELDLQQLVKELNCSEENDRRLMSKRRHDIYRDGGKRFLIEQIKNEFGEDSLKEMRLAPINLLKKIVNKRAAIYRRPPIRKAEMASDQKLVDFYVERMGMDEVMAKANAYVTLASNCFLYIIPVEGKLKALVVPSYLYGLKAKESDLTDVEMIAFSTFADRAQIEQGSATGQGIQVQINKTIDASIKKNYILWSKNSHLTIDEKGTIIPHAQEQEGVPADQQNANPIEMIPGVVIAKDRDNETWATQGEDMIELTIALQMGWTDLLTIAKHQGFAILTVVSEEQPKQLSLGINKAVWLKVKPGGQPGKIEYVRGNSPLAEYKELLMDLLGLLLSSNDMDPASIGGKNASKTFTSGFHALIAMADNLEAIEKDKPLMRSTEKEAWEVIKAWHNKLHEMGSLDDEARKLGKFSDQFTVSVSYGDVKPLESEQERLDIVERRMKLGLMDQEGAMKKLEPDMTDDQIKTLLDKIKATRKEALAEMLGTNVQMPDPSAEAQPEQPQGQAPAAPGQVAPAKRPSPFAPKK